MCVASSPKCSFIVEVALKSCCACKATLPETDVHVQAKVYPAIYSHQIAIVEHGDAAEVTGLLDLASEPLLGSQRFAERGTRHGTHQT